MKGGKKMITIEKIKDLLLSAGFPPETINLFVAQVLHETGGGTSNVARTNNNLTGIKFLNKPYQKNASQGLPSPEDNFYANFATLKDWALDYKRILSLGENKPINAKNVTELVDRLKANRYFTDGKANYFAGVTKYFNQLT